jgi:hypothetical protein
MDDDLSPPPTDVLEIHASAIGHGWMVKYDGYPQAFFSTGADLASWIKTVLTAADIEAGVVPAHDPTIIKEPMPRILHESAEKLLQPKPSRLWRVFVGGKQ